MRNTLVHLVDAVHTLLYAQTDIGSYIRKKVETELRNVHNLLFLCTNYAGISSYYSETVTQKKGKRSTTAEFKMPAWDL